MRRRTLALALAAALLLGMLAGAALGQVAWRFVRIAVPDRGYFANHNPHHCRTEDMVLVQRDYPSSVEWRCVHIDRVAP